MVAGPNLETRAEYRYLGMIGADVVGMSTAPEVIVANHMGLPCAAVSVVTDLCDPDNLEPAKLEDIWKQPVRLRLSLSGCSGRLFVTCKRQLFYKMRFVRPF